MVSYLMTILSPDKSNSILKLYHKLNKTIIPTIIPSVILSENNISSKFKRETTV